MLDLKAKIIEIEGKILIITGLVTNSALAGVENKIPGVINLVKKKQIIIQKLVKLKRRLAILIIINTLLIQNLIT